MQTWTVVRFFHILGIVFFVGGQLMLVSVVAPVVRRHGDDRAMALVGRRFGLGSVVALGVAVATGVAMASHFSLWDSQILRAKLMVLALVGVLAALHVVSPQSRAVSYAVVAASLLVVWFGVKLTFRLSSRCSPRHRSTSTRRMFFGRSRSTGRSASRRRSGRRVTATRSTSSSYWTGAYLCPQLDLADQARDPSRSGDDADEAFTRLVAAERTTGWTACAWPGSPTSTTTRSSWSSAGARPTRTAARAARSAAPPVAPGRSPRARRRRSPRSRTRSAGRPAA